MTERERLIERLTDTLHEWECDVQSETVSQIAEHLLNNGVIVPPCKIGDKVYEIINPFRTEPYLITSVVCAVHIADESRDCRNHKRESYILAKCPNTEYVRKYPLSKIGKTIFTSCEAAEKALKESEENGATQT